MVLSLGGMVDLLHNSLLLLILAHDVLLLTGNPVRFALRAEIVAHLAILS